MRKILTALAIGFLLTSCQKEISFGDDNNTGSGGTVPGGSADGDLMVRALQISPATNDTSILTCTWNTNKQLLTYNSNGKVQGTLIKINHNITRDATGKINTIISKTFVSGAISDSVGYRYFYNGSKVNYILSGRSTILGSLNDSTVLTYNSSNQVISKETFSDLFGSMDPLSKEEYQYDAAGNIKVVTAYTADFFTGTYTQSGFLNYTFDTHKAAVILGEEAFSIIGAGNISKNNVTKLVTNNVTSGTTYTATVTTNNFNSHDRPIQSNFVVMPQPPGYNQKVEYYYQ
ncbi:MAG TPA: hypothetical protein VGB71_01640 [Flavisolibacter sp.]|jgi:hypothetical protein